ncbi:glycosyltransferase family 4 protein [Alkalibacterium kapii]|uniref:Undecaprenyl-phosphate alpha-N-acetylglucosaminyl 1-phosphate transferase n=1 Tax=Alkalibacterium kapii TaxID=426704 RepID=A0A511ATT0_9LACT|nr:MraY family glycosyltransferase [Alkalibacterium kapii]GEK90491.1 undecaprenyl-phosphate alpha-N-acetylglucosaminyl 1-phosphate transferase [Alkalibacterium kapii]
MFDMFVVLLVSLFTMATALILTPLYTRLAYKYGITDNPEANERRIHEKSMPTMGGVIIYLSFYFAVFFLLPIPRSQLIPLFLASTLIIITGILDDLLELSPLVKLAGTIAAATVIYFFGDVALETMTFPYLGTLAFGSLNFPFTVLWIISFTNAINLVDGLDGLASGISMIALTTMGIIGFFFLTIEEVSVSIMIFILVAAIAGFWPYNFHPASVFLGDTGALFLGFMIGVFSLQGLKNATLISLVLPIIIMGIPITDTLFAMVRRKMNKQSIVVADKSHIHHRFMTLGLSHRQTVLAIYSVSAIFSIIALLYNFSTFIGSIVLTVFVLVGVLLFVEIIGLVDENKRPILGVIKRFVKKLNK